MTIQTVDQWSDHIASLHLPHAGEVCKALADQNAPLVAWQCLTGQDDGIILRHLRGAFCSGPLAAAGEIVYCAECGWFGLNINMGDYAMAIFVEGKEVKMSVKELADKGRELIQSGYAYPGMPRTLDATTSLAVIATHWFDEQHRDWVSQQRERS